MLRIPEVPRPTRKFSRRGIPQDDQRATAYVPRQFDLSQRPQRPPRTPVRLFRPPRTPVRLFSPLYTFTCTKTGRRLRTCTTPHVKRADLEAELIELGWHPQGPSGANHIKWAHPDKLHRVYVRQVAIIPNATAERILEEAGR